MADSAILLVDASEGPLPQTRFVLKKTFEAKLPVMVIINKIDRKDARIDEVLDMVYDLFIDLEATDDQLDFTYFYAIGRDGIVKKELDSDVTHLHELFDTIIEEMPPRPMIRKPRFRCWCRIWGIPITWPTGRGQGVQRVCRIQ